MTISLYQALDIFQENIPDIIKAMSDNLRHDITEEKKEAEILGTGEVADVVRSIRMHNKFDDRTRILNSIRAYHTSILHPRPGQITPADITRAREYPIQDLYTGKLRRQNKDLWGKCPFHNSGNERTPSFHINTQKNMWYCHGCSTGGDSINYYMRVHEVGFVQAVRGMVGCG